MVVLHPLTLLAAFVAAAFAFVSHSAPVMAAEATSDPDAKADQCQADSLPSRLDGAESSWGQLPGGELQIQSVGTNDGVAPERAPRSEASQHLLRASLNSPVSEGGVRASFWDNHAAITQVAVMVSAAITAQLTARSEDEGRHELAMQSTASRESASVASEANGTAFVQFADAASVLDRYLDASSSAFTVLTALAQPVNEPLEAATPSLIGSGRGAVDTALTTENGGHVSSIFNGAPDRQAWEFPGRSDQVAPATSESSRSVVSDIGLADSDESVRSATSREAPTLPQQGGRTATESIATAVSREPHTSQATEVLSAAGRQGEIPAVARSTAASTAEYKWVDWLRGEDGSIFNSGKSFLASISLVSGPDLVNRLEGGVSLYRGLRPSTLKEEDKGSTGLRGEDDRSSGSDQEVPSREATPEQDLSVDVPSDGANVEAASSQPAKTTDIVQTMFKILSFAKASETRLTLDSSELGFLKLFVENAPRLQDVESVLVFEGKGTAESVFMLMPGIAMISQHVLPEWVLLDDGQADIDAPFAQTLMLGQGVSVELVGVVPLIA